MTHMYSPLSEFQQLGKASQTDVFLDLQMFDAAILGQKGE